MCGILGTIPATEPAFFEKALSTIKHRGPDSFGVWHSSDISLGHRRLSIIDLTESGHQPMEYANGRLQIIFNGEIYNFVELRKELSENGFNFRSESDTEVILAAFLFWKEKALQKFNGMWALGIWDTESKSLFLARDRFGKKPLFYSFVDGKLVFASEMKAILPFIPKVKPSSNFSWMARNVFLYESTEDTLIEGIKRFPAGHYGIFSRGNLTLKRYWNVLDNLCTPPTDYRIQVEEFRELFLDACKIRMRSDVPVGTALSGGLDSSATISAMAHLSKFNQKSRESSDWQHAFVACFPNTPIDESRYARIVTDHIGIDATFINIDPLQNWHKLYEYLYLFEDLYITPPIPMIMTYNEVKAKGVTVTLDGHGADELFSGYGHLLEALIDAGFNLSKINDILTTYLGTLPQSSQISLPGKLRLYIEFLLKKAGKAILNKESKSRDILHANFRKMDNFSRQLYIIFNETILPTLLRNYDRYSMINSVEIRMPFLDHRLVSYVHSLPYSSKFGKGYTKRLIRDAMAPFMPKEITWRKTKIGFNSPLVNWMQGSLKSWFEDTVNSRAFLDCSLVEAPATLQQKIMKITSGQDSTWGSAETAWKELSPFLWEESFLKRKH